MRQTYVSHVYKNGDLLEIHAFAAGVGPGQELHSFSGFVHAGVISNKLPDAQFL